MIRIIDIICCFLLIPVVRPNQLAILECFAGIKNLDEDSLFTLQQALVDHIPLESRQEVRLKMQRLLNQLLGMQDQSPNKAINYHS